MKRLVGLGAGGHAKVIIDILLQRGEYQVCGVVDPRLESKGSAILGVQVLGGDEELPRLRREGVQYAFMGVASLSDTGTNRDVFERARALGFEMINVVHQHATVAPSVRMGCGNRVFAGAIVNPDTYIGDNVVINTGAIVEHDCRIEDHAQVAPGAQLAGNVQLGEGSIVGLGAAVIQGVSIGRFSMVGAGAVVVEDVPDNVTVVGVPARPLPHASGTSAG